MYRILFIDEEQDNIEMFEEYVEKFSTKEKIQLVTSYPLPTLEEMMDFIFKSTPDAVISDYRLNEKKTDIRYNVPYTGVDLIQEFQTVREDFPCFVLTAVDDEAVRDSEDVNKVYVKASLPNEIKVAKAKFLDRVISQVKHYKAKIDAAQAELNGLVAQREAGKADFKDEDRLIELDTFLEKSIDARNSIPPEFKSLSNTERLDNIINKVDELLKKIDENNGK